MLRQRNIVLIALPPGIQLLQSLSILPTFGLGDGSIRVGIQLGGVIDQLKLLSLLAIDLVLKFGIDLLAIVAVLVAESGGGVAGSLEAEGGEVSAAADAIGSTEGGVGE